MEQDTKPIMNSIFDGVDPVEASDIMGYLGITPQDLHFPDKYNKFQDVVKYFAGKQGKSYLLSKLTMGKGDDKLDHVFNYTRLRQEFDQVSKHSEELKKELSLYE